MRIIELKVDRQTTIHDFDAALLAALGAPDWHGVSIAAFVDSIVWGGVNRVEPPFKIVVTGAAKLRPEVLDEIELLAGKIRKHRAEFRNQKNEDVEVALEISD